MVRICSRPGAALRQGAAWLILGLLLVIGYSYRDMFRDLGARLSGELVPQQGAARGDEAISFQSSDDGHFHVEALVDGTRIVFMVDTGASDVVLSPADARLGFDPDSLAFTRIYETAERVGGAPALAATSANR